MNLLVFMQNVKRLLDERNISYSRAGRESGAGIDFVRNMERKNSWPSIEKVALMADYLGITVGELIGEQKSPIPDNEDRPPGLGQLEQIYCSLNPEGQETLLDYAIYLETTGRYIKSDPAQLGKEKNA